MAQRKPTRFEGALRQFGVRKPTSQVEATSSGGISKRFFPVLQGFIAGAQRGRFQVATRHDPPHRSLGFSTGYRDRLWHPLEAPGDTAYFRDKTATGIILMGRATYNEFAAPLHERENFVLTAHPGLLRAGFRAIGSLDQLVSENPEEDIWIIAGATVFAATIAEADELLLTQVSGDFDCAKFFPPYQADFRLAALDDERQDNEISYRFETWNRLASNHARSHGMD